ncbi:beta-ketoacyl synthase chain length factor [Chitinophaga sp. GCM10012297]|uniref:Beta-ketoacyl synthase chain length factor n=1 Tax=Chitinophaga chungangae TaxID=2821488 RepID=A0ABS3Y8U5_9BACT|nr:beta-ketoacyl synthase chain length factor [Chitinophaga chungangae]MBO9151061.1 beta-ketoacyl synthase chain length factor [Chitinophaga chungangae]
MQQAYIQGIGCVSAQDNALFSGTVRQHEGNRLPVADPDYKQWIDIKQIRRMGRVIKMGVAASHISLEQAGVARPDAIVMGTAYGCLADTGVFLNKLVTQNEDMLTPTAFIQSTHNTVSGQIALMLGCHAYNNTFVHGAFSLENALQDSLLLLAEDPSKQILAGAVDEITDYSHNILSRFRLYKNASTQNLLQSNTHGTIAGEGAVFFVLGAEKNERSMAALTAVEMLYNPASEKETFAHIAKFLDTYGQPDLLLAGRNGDTKNDAYYAAGEEKLFAGVPVAAFKHLCGEFPTAAAFAMWMAAGVLKNGAVPAAAMFKGKAPAAPKKILIWNHGGGKHHSLILLSAC